MSSGFIRALALCGAALFGALALHAFETSSALAKSDATPAPATLPQNGLVGKGTLVGRTALGGNDTLTLGGNIAFEARGPLVRLDILSLGIPGADPTLSTLAQSFIAPGGYTVVYDRSTSNYVVWSKAKQSYYENSVGNVGQRSPQPLATTAQGTTGVGESDLLGAFGFAKSLKDLKIFSIQLGLAGHGTVNAHAATGIDFAFARQANGGDPLNVHGRIQFADDLDGFPVQVNATVKTQSFGLDAQLDLTNIEKRVPDQADFDIPSGFTRAADLGGVLGGAIPIPH